MSPGLESGEESLRAVNGLGAKVFDLRLSHHSAFECEQTASSTLTGDLLHFLDSPFFPRPKQGKFVSQKRRSTRSLLHFAASLKGVSFCFSGVRNQASKNCLDFGRGIDCQARWRVIRIKAQSQESLIAGKGNCRFRKSLAAEFLNAQENFRPG
jgi:hypothetical protein